MHGASIGMTVVGFDGGFGNGKQKQANHHVSQFNTTIIDARARTSKTIDTPYEPLEQGIWSEDSLSFPLRVPSPCSYAAIQDRALSTMNQATDNMDKHSGEGLPGPLHDPDPLTQSGAQDTTAPPLQVNISVGDLMTGPGAFSRQLVRDHLNPAARLALFRTCTAGRDTVLGAAEQATIQSSFRSDYQTNTPAFRLNVASRAMAARGQLRTKLHLVVTNPHQLASILQGLGGGSAWLDELCMQSTTAILSNILATAGCACPHLRALRISGLCHELPNHQLFPKLKELTITHPHSEHLLRTIAPYVPQLTALGVLSVFKPTNTTLPLLLSPANTGTHLHTLHLNAVLDDTLLGFILQCAPAVEQLTVHRIQLQSTAHVQAQHQWQRLQFRVLHLSTLACLPLTSGMQLVFDTRTAVAGLVCDTTSIEVAVAERLKGLQFSIIGAYKLYVQGDESINHADDPAALRAGLSLLRHWPVPEYSRQPEITLSGWFMIDELIAELSGLPRFRALRLTELLVWANPLQQRRSSLLRLLPDSYRSIGWPDRYPTVG